MYKIANSKANSASRFATVVIIITMFLVIVFPNAFRPLKAGLFGVLTIIILPYFMRLPKQVRVVYLLGVLVTVFYELIGLDKSKMPLEATMQTFLVYILSPLFWIALSKYLLEKYDILTIVKTLNIFTFIGSLTVFIGLWLFQHGYKNVLEFIIENPNQTFTSSGLVAIKFHVYGSLIFLFPAFIQLYPVITRYKYVVMLFIAVITTVISGRDALILSIFIGIFLFIVISKSKLLKYVLYFIPAILIVVVLLQSFGVNLTNTLQAFVDKVQSGGGDERSQQFGALLRGTNNNYFLGSGHGVGVSYIRSTDYPWRYEILPLATLFRTGIIGLIIYALPLIMSCNIFLRKKIKKLNTAYDNYFFVGFVSLCLASFTNPYLESFEFQWGFFFVFIYFVGGPVNNTKSLSHDNTV